MTIKESLRGALRRLAGARVPDQRRTLALPSMLVPYGARVENLPKPTPANLRRFAETPIARKAINTVKDRIAGMKWRIQPKNGRALSEIPNGAERIALLADNLDAPNSDDSFRSFAEQVLEDIIVGGFGVVRPDRFCATDRDGAVVIVNAGCRRLAAQVVILNTSIRNACDQLFGSG